MPIRRAADPLNVIRIWDAIKSASGQAETSKIVKYLQKADPISQAQAELHIKQALRDGLIVSNTSRLSGKGGGEHVYRITTQGLPELDNKDWYCFECHLAGDVKTCKNCFRVFHSDCTSTGRRTFEKFKKAKSHSKPVPKSKEKTNENKDTIHISSDESEDVVGTADNVHGRKPSNGIANSSDSAVHSSTSSKKSKRAYSIGSYTYDDGLCSVCNISNIDEDCGLDKPEINYLLKFVLHRIRSWLPNTITHTMAHEDRPAWLTDSELTWRANQLFYEHRDMSVIDVKLNTETYGSLSEFLADILTVQHNVAIFHGIESQEYGASELMVRDTIHDLNELTTCVDCYKHSNEKINPKWFCLPCRIPHKLVWAKQKGYPYWPAKVIKETPTHIDVRFFGGKYERSLLVKSFIKPISVPKENLQIKMSAAFTKAYEELQFHQKLLKDTKELEALIASSKQKKKSPAKPKATPSKTSTPKNNKIKKSKPSPSKTPSEENKVVNKPVKRKGGPTSETPEKNKKMAVEPSCEENETISGNVINISDGEDEPTEYSFRENGYTLEAFPFDETSEQVTSSTETFKSQDVASVGQDVAMQQLDHPYSDSVERMRRKLELLTNKKDIIKCAMECMQAELDKVTNDHNDHLKRLFESHNAQISETKKKQWCYNCEQDAIYHCCWNTAYCSQTCQQQHWQAEHKKVCRRKR